MNYKLTLLILCCATTIYAQQPTQHHSSHHPDSTEHHHHRPGKGPNNGRITHDKDIKVEMLTPFNIKKLDVSYFIFDTLEKPLEAKNYKGTVRYIFGKATQYIDVHLVAKGKPNQFVSTLEDWHDYRQAIVTLKRDTMTYRISFYNPNPVQAKQPPSKITNSHHSGDNRHH